MGFLRFFIILVILVQILLIIGVVAFSRKIRRILRPGSKPLEERKGVLKVDPVCGSLVEETVAEVMEQGDRRYYFCSRQCREEFLER
jgi:YHS domain-containing protein